MASQTQGIQQLLAAEKRAAEKVAEARKRKAKRTKQARDEAAADIEKYRLERDRQFKDYEVKHMGFRDNVAARINKDTEVQYQRIAQAVDQNKEFVVNELLRLVFEIETSAHPNYFVMNPRKQ